MFVAMLAMLLMVAAPALAQPIEFIEGGVLVTVQGTGSLEEAPVTGVVGVPSFGGAVAGEDTLSTGDSLFVGGFATASGTVNAFGGQEGVVVQAGSQCIDTTDFGLCP